LPPDAVFCHKCGKPQRAEQIEAGEPELPVAAAPVVAPLPVNFHNPIAVRAGLTMASLAALLSWLPFLNLGLVVWWLLAGFFSVYLYRYRTGQSLTMRGGLQMGWITGILTFALTMLLFTFSLVVLALSKGGFTNLLQQARQMAPNDPNLEQAVRAFQTPTVAATAILFTLALFFALIMLLCTLGAALGARMGRNDSRTAV